MNYRPSRDEREAGIKKLAELYPQAFFEEPRLRRPLKKGIIADVEKDGAPMAHELITASVDWYMSHFSYQTALQAGAKRIDLHGREVTAVTEQEARNAEKYVRERRQEEHNRKLDLAIPKTMILPKIAIPKESTMPKENTPMKAVKTADPLVGIQTLLDAVRNALLEQPEALRQPFAVAGLRVVVVEIEKFITTMNGTNHHDE